MSEDATPTGLSQLKLVHCMDMQPVHEGLSRWEPARLTQWWEGRSLPDSWSVLTADPICLEATVDKTADATPAIDQIESPPATRWAHMHPPQESEWVRVEGNQLTIHVRSDNNQVAIYLDVENPNGSWGPATPHIFAASPAAPLCRVVEVVGGTRYRIAARFRETTDAGTVYWALVPGAGVKSGSA